MSRGSSPAGYPARPPVSYQCLPTTHWVDPSSTGEPRLRGALDEVGYLSYSNRHADLLFEIVARRHQKRSTVITTNRPFAEWREMFPGAACVVSLVDRIVHNAEVIALDGDSYRLKEAQERAARKQRQRRSSKA